jgi:hypothetical protein
MDFDDFLMTLPTVTVAIHVGAGHTDCLTVPFIPPAVFGGTTMSILWGINTICGCVPCPTNHR